MSGKPNIPLMLLFEVLGLALLPAIFLSIYIQHFGGSGEAVFRHYQWIGAFWSFLVLIRALLSRHVPAKLALLLSSFFIALFFALLAIYYALVFVGLTAWGRVISLDLIVTYVMQISPLAKAIEIPLAPVSVILLAACLLLWFGCFLWLRRFDWVAPLHRSLPRRLSLEAIACYALISIGSLWLMIPSTGNKSEPFTLTLHPGANEPTVQSHRHALDTRLSEIEAQARANYAPSSAGDRHNVILIVVDALRSDHLGFNGYQRETSPNLDRRVKKNGVQAISRMYSVCAESACGLMALASSRYLHQLPRKPITLQELLMRHGYQTHMILGGDHTNFYGLREAYGPVNTYYDGSMAKGYYFNDDKLVVDRLKQFDDWQGSPIFMQFHLMSAHGLGYRDKAFDRFVPARNHYKAQSNSPEAIPKPIDPQHVNFYDNGVLQADDTIEKILNALEQKGYLKNALVILTADHGDLLGEHGYFAHAKTIYEAVLDVPFVMLRYGYTSRLQPRMGTIASQIDVAPTILAELGIPRPVSWKGIALQKEQAQLDARRYIFFQQKAEYGLFDLHAGKNALWKYCVNAKSRTRHAYDVLTDRSETNDILPGIPTDVVREWTRDLLELQAAAHDQIDIPDPEFLSVPEKEQQQ